MTTNPSITPDRGTQPEPETPQFETRLHWAVLLNKIIPSTLALFGALVVVGFVGGLPLVQSLLALLQLPFWLIAFAAAVYSTWAIAEWWIGDITVTDKNFRSKFGILRTKQGKMSRNRLDVDFEQSWLGQQLGYGTLKLDSPSKKAVIEYAPKRLYSLLSNPPASS